MATPSLSSSSLLEQLRSIIGSAQNAGNRLYSSLFEPEIAKEIRKTDPFRTGATQAPEDLLVSPLVGPPEPTEFTHPTNLRATVLGLGDLAKGLLTAIPAGIAQATQIAAPASVDLRKTPLVQLFPEIVEKPEQMFESGPGLVPSPISVIARGAEALGLTQAWERQTELEKQQWLKEPSFLRKAIRTAGELTFSPILDAAFNVGIDPDRISPSQRYRALPGALIQAVAVGSGGFGTVRNALRSSGLSAKAPLVPLAEIVKNNERRLISLKDIGKVEEPMFGIGDNIFTTEGLAEIVGETARNFQVNVDGKTLNVSKAAARRAATAADSAAFDIDRAWKSLENQADLDASGPSQIAIGNPTLKALVETFDPVKAGVLAAELLSKQELNQLGVMRAYTTTLKRALDPKPYALKLMKDTPDLTLDAAMNLSEGRINKILSTIEASGSEAGMNLKVFSDMKELIEAQRRLSPDATQRLLQLNKDAAIHGAMDRYAAYIDGPMRSSMVSGFRTLTRNVATQFARGLVNGIEHGMSDLGVGLIETLKGKKLLEGEVNPKFLRRDGTIDYSRIFADTMSDLAVMGREASDVIDAAKAFAYDARTGGELRDYHNATVRALARGEDPPIAPPFFTGRFSEWETVKKLYPREMDELLNTPSGEAPISALYNPILKARMINNFKDLFRQNPDVPANWTAANQLIDATVPSAIQYATAKLTALNGMSEIWQRRLFATARMDAWARREGKTLSEFFKEGAKAIKVGKGETPRPQSFDKALWDSVGYANSSTWANRRHGGAARAILDAFENYKPLHQLITPFPSYFFNRTAFLSEHMPTKILGMLNKDFYKKLVGEVTEADAIADMRRDFYSNKKNRGKEFEPPENISELMPAIRADAQREAASAASKVLVGMSAIGLGSYVIDKGLTGSRWNLMRHPTETDENGRPLEFDIRPWDSFALPIGLAKAIDSVAQGRKLTDAFSADDMMELLSGIRRVDDTALGVFDLPQLIEGGDPEEVFTDFVAKLAGSNIGKMFVFFRNSKELAGMADLRAFPFEGRDELVVPNQQMDPFLGPALANLPRGFQRSLLGEPLPALNSPFRSEHLHNQYPLYGWMTGANLKSKTVFEDLIDTTDLRVSDAIGRQSTEEMKQLMAGELGKFFEREIGQAETGPNLPSRVRTVGDIYADVILNMEADLRRSGIQPTTAFREEQLRRIFADARHTVEPFVIQSLIATGDIDLIKRVFGKEAFQKLGAIEKSLVQGAN